MRQTIAEFFFMATLTGRYTNSPETRFESDLSLIREEWGAGAYQLRVIGRKGLIARIAVNIAEMVNRNPPAAQPAQNSELAAVLSQLAQSQQAILQALTQRPDPQAEMLRQLEMMRVMRDVFAPPPAAAPAALPPPRTLTEQLAEMANARKMIAEIAGDDGEKKDSTDPMAMLPDILGIVRGAMAGQQQAPQAPQPAYQAAPQQLAAPNPAPQPAGAAHAPEAEDHLPEPEAEEMNAFTLQMVRMTLDRAVAMSQAGKTPAEIAEFLEPLLPDAFIPFLDTPDWWTALCNLAPKIAPHQALFAAVKPELEKLLDADDSDDPA